ncbi:MAG: YlmC/YmxH family sporulation protein [Peptococcaceae bacterium MAG4]|nr:YlmC/YmxH family sporulation protein [Peptococcaceae bacterium MAG4]
MAALQFRISELAQRDIINLVDGARLGPVKDVYIDLESGQVLSLVLAGERKYFKLLNAGSDLIVPWEKVRKVGVHTVLVEVD